MLGASTAAWSAVSERLLDALFDRASRYAAFTRRLGMTGGMAAVFAVLAGGSTSCRSRTAPVPTQAEDNRVNQRLAAARAHSIASVELANNRRNYRVLLVSEQATEGVEAALTPSAR